MTKLINKHDAGESIITVPGVGVVFTVSATTSTAGTGAGYAPGCLLLTTTTKTVYVNEGSITTASWQAVATET